MCRDDNPSLQELVAVALETGREGIRAWKAQDEPAPKAAPAPKPAAQPAAPRRRGGHMTIALARIMTV